MGVGVGRAVRLNVSRGHSLCWVIPRDYLSFGLVRFPFCHKARERERERSLTSESARPPPRALFDARARAPYSSSRLGGSRALYGACVPPRCQAGF